MSTVLMDFANLVSAGRDIESARRRRLSLILCCIWVGAIATFTAPGREDAGVGASLDLIAKVKIVSRLAITAMIGLLIFDQDSWNRSGWLRRVMLPMALYLAWAAASVFWSPLRTFSGGQFLSFAVLVGLTYVTAANVRCPTDVSMVIRHLCWSTGAISLVLTAAHFLIPDVGRLSRLADSGFMHPTAAASTAASGAMALLSALVIWRWEWAKREAWILFPIYAAMLFAAENRMSLIMLFLAGGGMVLRYVPWRRLFPYAVGGAALVLVYVLCDPAMRLAMKALGGADAFVSRGQSSEELGTLSGRYEMWQAQWESFLESPWMGHGYFVTSRTGELYVWFESDNWTAHNLPLQVLVTTGVIGLSLFVVGLVVWWRVAREAGRLEGQSGATTALGWMMFWFAGWGAINESIAGPFQPESVVFFTLWGVALAQAAPDFVFARQDEDSDASCETDPAGGFT